jgi:hypothetical protein
MGRIGPVRAAALGVGQFNTCSLISKYIGDFRLNKIGDVMLYHQRIIVIASSPIMRTTLDLEEDVLLAAKERAARERRSLGAVISALARESLRRPAPSADVQSGARPPGGRFAVLPSRDEVITVEHVKRLRDAEGV